MNNIQIFKHELFGQLRAMLNDDGEPLLMGADVARNLGYKNPKKKRPFLARAALFDYLCSAPRAAGKKCLQLCMDSI